MGEPNDGDDDENGGSNGRLDMVVTVGVDCALPVVGDIMTIGELLGVPNRTFTVEVDGVFTGAAMGAFTGDRDDAGTDVGEEDVGNNGGGVNPATSGFGPSMTPDAIE